MSAGRRPGRAGRGRVCWPPAASFPAGAGPDAPGSAEAARRRPPLAWLTWTQMDQAALGLTARERRVGSDVSGSGGLAGLGADGPDGRRPATSLPAGPGSDAPGSAEAGPEADQAGGRLPSLFEPWSAETGWAGTGVADAGGPEPGEPGAGPGVAGSGGSRASTFEPGSTDRAGLGADGLDGQGETGLDFGPWANGPAPDGGAAGFAQPGWPAGAEPDSPVARASWLDADSPASPGADAGVNLFSPDAGPAAARRLIPALACSGRTGCRQLAPGPVPAQVCSRPTLGLRPATTLIPAVARSRTALAIPLAPRPVTGPACSARTPVRRATGRRGRSPAPPAADGRGNGAHAGNGAWPWRDVQPGREQPSANGRPHGPGPAGTAAAPPAPGGSAPRYPCPGSPAPGRSRTTRAPQQHPGSGLNIGAGMLAGAAGVLGAAAARIRARRPDADPSRPLAPGASPGCRWAATSAPRTEAPPPRRRPSRRRSRSRPGPWPRRPPPSCCPWLTAGRWPRPGPTG